MKRFTASLLLLLSLSVSVTACLWDRDTFDQERRRFPSILELITGHFLRHSPEFYRWRIDDREAQLKESPETLTLYDDLAVAHEKLGRHQVAIDLMRKKDQIQSGLYETHANLGTFYIHDGQFEQGLIEIKKAISINPDAHFGREIYQARLVEYLLTRVNRDPVTAAALELPLDNSNTSNMQPRGFAAYLIDLIRNDEADLTQDAGDSGNTPAESENADAISRREELMQEELANALKGVSGMMRFGNFDSPVLLEALGDLLLAQGVLTDGKQLAARAYLKASYETDGATSANYRNIAERALHLQVTSGKGNQQLSLAVLEKQFQAELNQADTWYQGVSQSEKAWIQAGVNPEREFEKAYPVDPEIPISSTSTFGSSASDTLIPTGSPETLWKFALFLLCPLAILWTWKRSQCCKQAIDSKS